MKKFLKGFMYTFLVIFVIGFFSSLGDDSKEEVAQEDEIKPVEEVSASEDESVQEEEETAEEDVVAHEEVEEDEDNEEAVETVAEESEPEEEVVAPDNGILEESALEILEENFAGVGDVEFLEEEMTYVIYPTDPLFVTDLMGIMNGTIALSEWDMVKESMAGLSSSFQELLGNGYIIAVANPVNYDNFILIAMDGVIMFDAISAEVQ